MWLEELGSSSDDPLTILMRLEEADEMGIELEDYRSVYCPQADDIVSNIESNVAARSTASRIASGGLELTPPDGSMEVITEFADMREVGDEMVDKLISFLETRRRR